MKIHCASCSLRWLVVDAQGYGATITSGGGVTAAAVAKPERPRLATHLSGSSEQLARFDPRIKAVLSFAPWGNTAGFWDESGLAGVKIPTFLVVGSKDTTSGYEKGVGAMFEQMTGVDRYLLTYENAGHNAGAPMPAPAESWAHSEKTPQLPSPSGHYVDAVWDSVRMNNIVRPLTAARCHAFAMCLRVVFCTCGASSMTPVTSDT